MSKLIEKIRNGYCKIQMWIEYNDVYEKIFASGLLAGLIALIQMIWNFSFGAIHHLDYLQAVGAFVIYGFGVGLYKSIK